MKILIVIWVVVLVAIYFLPTILGRKKRNVVGIFLLNLFLGWTFMGWVGALVWSVLKDNKVSGELVK